MTIFSLSLFQNFLENLDIFGICINIRFRQKVQHTTKVGGLITIIIIAVLAYQTNLVINSLVDYKNPTVLYEEKYVDSPERFNMTKTNFSIMFGMRDSQAVNFFDPQIFTFKLQMKQSKRLMNEQTGTFFYKDEFVDVQIEQCTEDHFQHEETKAYFRLQDFQKFYCISKQEQGIYLQGRKDSEIYSSLQLTLSTCQGPNCKTKDEISKKVSSGRLTIYFSDYNLVPSERLNPFQPIGKYVYWVSSMMLTKTVNVYFKKTFLNTDEGLLGQNYKTEQRLTFSSDREQVAEQRANILFSVLISQVKDQVSVYNRSYPKLDRALSQIGGIFNILFVLGAILCKPLSQIELNTKIINSFFKCEIEDGNESKDQKLINLQKLKKYEYEEKVKSLFIRSTDNAKQIDNTIQSGDNKLKHADSNLERESLKKSLNSQTSDNVCSLLKSQLASIAKNDQILLGKKTTKKILESPRTIVSQNRESLDKNKTKNLELFFKEGSINIKLGLWDYVSSLFKCTCFCKKNRKTMLLQKGVDKLYNHIDIYYLLNKLLEIEKLKYLLLSEQQIKLFEFIPKPTLCEDETKIKSKSLSDKIFHHDGQNIIEKTLSAHEAFQTIMQEPHISKTNQRLLELIDPKFKLLLQEISNMPTIREDNAQREMERSSDELQINQEQTYENMFQTDPNGSNQQSGSNRFRLLQLPEFYNRDTKNNTIHEKQ